MLNRRTKVVKREWFYTYAILNSHPQVILHLKLVAVCITLDLPLNVTFTLNTKVRQLKHFYRGLWKIH